jgi:DNA-binding PadR family transcriptional regulator
MPERTIELTTTEYAVLGLLSNGRARSGYDLRKDVDRNVGYFWAPTRSQIYAVLPRLVASGHLRVRHVAQRDRPDKQLYRITKRGLAALRDWLETGPVPQPARNPFLLKVFFGGLASREAMLEQIRGRRREAEQLKRELLRLDADAAHDADDLFPSLTRRYGFEYADGVIRWARAAERELAGAEAAR